MRRRPAEPGHRPPRHEVTVTRTCIVCLATFTLDRRTQPWSRARTCAPRCAKVLANRARHAGTCRHCVMVAEFYLAQDADIRRIETASQNEDARPVTFRTWLRHYGWHDREEEAS